MKGLICVICMLLLPAAGLAEDEIQGKIESVDAGNGIVVVSGVKIAAKTARIEIRDDTPGTLSELKEGNAIEAEGSFTGIGEFTARKIEVEGYVDDKLEGSIEAVDTKARTITISGITVNVPESAYLEDDNGDKPITLEELTAGTRADCKGQWTGPKEFTAVKIEIN